MPLWGCFEIWISRLSKEDQHHQCRWVFFNLPSRKRQRKGKFALGLSWVIHLLQTLVVLVLGLQTQMGAHTIIISSVGSQAFDFGLILDWFWTIPPALLDLQPADSWSWGCSVSIIMWAHPLQWIFFYIFIHAS